MNTTIPENILLATFMNAELMNLHEIFAAGHMKTMHLKTSIFFLLRLTSTKKKRNKRKGNKQIADKLFWRISSESPKVNGNFEIEAHFSCADLFSFRHLSFRLFFHFFFFVSFPHTCPAYVQCTHPGDHYH